MNWSNFSGRKDRSRTFWSNCRDRMWLNLIEAFGSQTFLICLRLIDYHNVGHMLCMHARPHASRSPFPLCLFSCSTSFNKMGAYAAPRGRGALEEMGTYPTRFFLFLKILSAAIRFVSQKLKFRIELFESHSKIWYIDPRTNSDFRSRSFDLFPLTHILLRWDYFWYTNFQL